MRCRMMPSHDCFHYSWLVSSCPFGPVGRRPPPRQVTISGTGRANGPGRKRETFARTDEIILGTTLLVNDTHSALTELFGDAVVADGSAD